MMGTLATVMAGKKIATPESRYWAEVEGDIENVNGVLKITRIRVKYSLKVPADKAADAREAFASYITRCPAAQSVIGCIDLKDELVIEETA
jgi:organic hydroperoxide reductase OsmC/OhrA